MMDLGGEDRVRGRTDGRRWRDFGWIWEVKIGS